MKTIVLSLLFFCPCIVQAQITFQKTIGTPDSLDGWFRAFCVQSTNDGNYILTGHGYDPNMGAALIKLSNTGNIIWSKILRNSILEGNSVQQTIDGGYVIAATHGLRMIKTDDSGNVSWAKTYYGTVGKYVQQTSDGGFILLGTVDNSQQQQFNNDIQLVKTDAQGNATWQRVFGGAGQDFGYSAKQTDDDGYIVVGTSYSFNNSNSSNIFLTKFDSSGTLLWAKTFNVGFATDIQETSDGGYIIAASYGVNLIKIDSNGNILWAKKYDGISYPEAVKQTTDGGYIICGSNLNTVNYAFLLKVDGQGNSQWSKTYSYDAVFRSVIITNDNGYLAVGITRINQYGSLGYDALIVKTDDQGNSGCTDTAFTVNTIDLSLLDSNVTPIITNNNFFNNVPVYTGSEGTVFSICSTENVTELNNDKNTIVVSPNPAREHFTITCPNQVKKAEFVITDILGNVVMRRNISKLTTTIDFNGAQGIYFLRVYNNEISYSAKIVIQ